MGSSPCTGGELGRIVPGRSWFNNQLRSVHPVQPMRSAMLERISLLKIAMAAVFAASLAALPLTIRAQEYTDPPTKSDTPAKAKKKAATKKTTATAPAEPK